MTDQVMGCDHTVRFRRYAFRIACCTSDKLEGMVRKTIVVCMMVLCAPAAGAEDWIRRPINGGFVEADMDSVKKSPQGTRTVNFRFRWDPAIAMNDGQFYDAAESVWELDCEGRRFRVAFSRTLFQGTELSGQRRTSDWLAIAPKHFLFDRACERDLSERMEARPAMPATGTGFFITRQGHVLTNAHVVRDCKTIELRAPGRTTHAATLVAVDNTNDLALLRTAAIPSAIAIFRDAPIVMGERVYVFGFPLTGALASSGSFADGVVSATAGLRDDTSQIQISAPIQPGSSGGPLLDTAARVSGIVVSKLDPLAVAKATGDLPQNVNFAIKHSVALTFLDAHDVKATLSDAAQPLNSSAIAAKARTVSVLVECIR